KLTLRYEYLGEQSVKNITEPVRVWQMVMEPGTVVSEIEAGGQKAKGNTQKANVEGQPRRVGTARMTQVALGLAGLLPVGGLVTLLYPSLEKLRLPLSAIRNQEAPPLPDKPSIAVLPFTNMSGDPEQEYFSDGMTEDLITALSKLSGLFVIARHSAFVYKGK